MARYVGADGTPSGWVAVVYEDNAFATVETHPDVESLWDDNDDAETILLDVPIGLPSDSVVRAPEAEARDVLSARTSSVFNVPIRPLLCEEYREDYEDANKEQKEEVDKGLQRQTHNILPLIAEVDDFLRADRDDGRQEIIRESHPEIAFWALNGKTEMTYSKTGQPAAAFWERVAVLEGVVGEGFRDHLFAAGETIAGRDVGDEPDDQEDVELSNDDLLDAFALAVTASDHTGDLETLPDAPDEDEEGLPMEMVYALP